MADIRLGYFLEDVGQEAFLVALVKRIAQDAGLQTDDLTHDPRSVVGGRGTAVSELQRFLLDVRRGHEIPFDVLIVAIDGNCWGYAERRDQIRHVVERAEYPGVVVCAIPDPHVERWYLVDAQCLRQVIGTEVQPEVPAYKCERGRYKYALREVLRQAGIVAPLGGAEFGPDVARELNMYIVGRADAAFRHFVDELSAALSTFVRLREKSEGEE